VASLSGQRSHAILSHALTAVANLSHRGAVVADRTGDGAGVLTQIPYALLRRHLALEVADEDIAVGMLFLPASDPGRNRGMALVERAIHASELKMLAWREVPVRADTLGDHARATQPYIAQVLISRGAGRGDAQFDRDLYRCRKHIEQTAAEVGLGLYVPSLSRRTIVYKGLLSSPQLSQFYPDLLDPGFETSLAVFHQRYSTNTFPSWHLAQPFRFIAHNGEINTLQGNMHWTRAREPALSSSLWGDQIRQLLPVLQAGGSDSAILDNVVDLLVHAGRDLPHALLMLVPQAWEGAQDLPELLRGFYEYHSCLTEPWDGPAALAFSDGTIVGGSLDRNGLRPARYLRTDDGLVVMASEVGVLDIPQQRIVEKGRLGPGQMIVVDTARHLLLTDELIKTSYARRQPYSEWVRSHLVRLVECAPNGAGTERESLQVPQNVFGFTIEDITRILQPMVSEGKDPVFSMGDDIPPAVLSSRPRLLYQYFKQRFAQVTNPPIDPLRERLVMSLSSYMGARGSLLEESPAHARLIHLATPILLPDEFAWLKTNSPIATTTLQARFRAAGGAVALAQALEDLVSEASAPAERAGIVILSDLDVDAEYAPLPMLLAVSAVHHGLIRRGLRMQVSLIAETSEARDIHHLACLFGYGASAVVPSLAYRTLAADPQGTGDVHSRWTTYRKAAEGGLLKIMAKMGISTFAGYCGAQIFEAIGLNQPVIERYFPGTPSRIGGIGLPEIAADVLERHRVAFSAPVPLKEAGYVRFRRDGEYHAFNPYVIKALHRAARQGDEQAYQAFTKLVGSRPPTTLRDLLEFVPQTAIPLEDVEPVKAITSRFVISAMSHGALSREAHQALAIAANRLGARSNSGEGGEDPSRYWRRAGEEWSNSRIKQIASARFGVTPEYVLSADELEIKMAQGSKPGEGGQLPGHKVSEEIARIRRAQRGTTLISPPPHHDIYSIEDLAQLIYDLKRMNPRARIAVKLVAESGVGTVAAGVAKAFADTIQISGNDGGTGASPLDSIKNAGVPWEVGLAETQHILVANDLRGRVRLRVDGGLKAGRDVVIAALIGADEFGFGTAA
ncbi:MAG TPA: glutamate synthase large subunit, partial [bacterium]|nr:glutamate synthase large subunit [bacterium]